MILMERTTLRKFANGKPTKRIRLPYFIILLWISSFASCCMGNEYSYDLQYSASPGDDRNDDRALLEDHDQTTSIAPTPTPAPTPIQIFWRSKNSQEEVRYTHLSDVWSCLIIALGWTVWLVAASVRSQLKRYATEGILVKGHVLQATCDVAGGSAFMGIPNYYALIDYLFEDSNGNVVKVRKTFQTQHFLAVGFANVDILVLADDPKSGVLKQEWDKEYKKILSQKDCRLLQRGGLFALGIILVVVTITGAAQVVKHLPEDQKMYGRLSVYIAVAIMWPTAIAIHWVFRTLKVIFSDSNTYGCNVLQGQHAELQPTPISRRSNVCGAFEAFDGLELPTMISPTTTTPVPINPVSTQGESVASVIEAPPLMISQNESFFVCMSNAKTSQCVESGSISSMSTMSVPTIMTQDSQTADEMVLCGLSMSGDGCDRFRTFK